MSVDLELKEDAKAVGYRCKRAIGHRSPAGEKPRAGDGSNVLTLHVARLTQAAFRWVNFHPPAQNPTRSCYRQDDVELSGTVIERIGGHNNTWSSAALFMTAYRIELDQPHFAA